MLIRYRRLSRTFDPGEYKRLIANTYDASIQEAEQDPFGDDEGKEVVAALAAAGAAFVGIASTPRKIDSTDGEAPLEKIREMVRAGTLKPTDLVDSGRGWELVSDCPLLLDASE